MNLSINVGKYSKAKSIHFFGGSQKGTTDASCEPNWSQGKRWDDNGLSMFVRMLWPIDSNSSMIDYSHWSTTISHQKVNNIGPSTGYTIYRIPLLAISNHWPINRLCDYQLLVTAIYHPDAVCTGVPPPIFVTRMQHLTRDHGSIQWTNTQWVMRDWSPCVLLLTFQLLPYVRAFRLGHEVHWSTSINQC